MLSWGVRRGTGVLTLDGALSLGEGCGVVSTSAAACQCVPIEHLGPEQWVLGHDGLPHRVVRTIQGSYDGPMMAIQRTGHEGTLWVASGHRVLCQRRTQSPGGEARWRNVPGGNFERARQMRRDLTVAERHLWSLLRRRQLGGKFRRQHPVGPYILDFYSRDGALAVEVDGPDHLGAEARQADAQRDAYLESLGLTILRFTNCEVTESTESVCQRIVRVLTEVVPTEDKETQWRRADSLREADVVYHSLPQASAEVTSLRTLRTSERLYDLEVEGARSYVTEVCTVHGGDWSR